MARNIMISLATVENLAQRVAAEDNSGLANEYTLLDIERAVQRSLERAVFELVRDFTDRIWSPDSRVKIWFDVQRTCDWSYCERPAKPDCLFCVEHQAEEDARCGEVQP